MKRICGFCGRVLDEDEIEEFFIEDEDMDEDQCPYCGYHAPLISEPYDN